MARDSIAPLIDAIKKLLFTPERRRLSQGIDRIVDQHDEGMRTQILQGFVFNGETYRHSQARIIYKSYPTLLWPLNESMEKWIKDKQQIDLDERLIGQVLFKLLYQANDMQEIRDTLPDCLVALIPELSNMPRKNNQTFIVRHNERDLRQFEKILPKIEMYAMTNLIY